MPKMIVSIDGVVIKEVQLTKDRTTLGRRPYNDIVIDNLAVSGEHAVLQLSANEVWLEDLNSTNGTYVNGKAVKRQLLQHDDSVEIGKYKIRFIHEAAAHPAYDRTMIMRPGTVQPTGPGPAPGTSAPAPLAAASGAPAASIRVLSGAAAGREVALVKVVTTVGKPGVAVAAITRRGQAYVVAHVDGANQPTLNGTTVGADPVALRHGDLLELAGTQMQFVQTG